MILIPCGIYLRSLFRYILDLFHPIMKLAEKLDLPEVREFAVMRTLGQFEEFLDTKTFLRLSDKEMQVFATSAYVIQKCTNFAMNILSSNLSKCSQFSAGKFWYIDPDETFISVANRSTG